ncbi:coproporphyrinogen III oxidase [Dyadobacter sp. BE34]|uniref:coproporphyrinogen oxidase n=1 Tax=Dyadobacter fermentans TaxID=94254 RepID=A0ABU1R248_9BACT|nr:MULTISPECIES: oxygen-dependent coproporphyrinogen oxidase [Dyadobacter]MDR6807487.1 coproporphyrinogen III oxidase [Dyadobacter fermentans]MDR7045228.1 coproporphyrinogen III oxidase [Dyadobacter sp. BE242]MDR7199035.1 coproporphyrinogen III oxidase [Dyadobacter sp. BE34]MDR7216995.1 coproporphyrinogen III oxidase [Dyadobacter sp. BE31]MDR7264928.1 coproporphyrinogen III oxidase [Dyadobacter sp. BE32]
MKVEDIESFFKDLQDRICTAIATTDGGAQFHEDLWQHHSGGGGRTRLIQNGAVIEKGGVNFSSVRGEVHPRLRAQMNLPEDANPQFTATGVSIVMHPRNPHVPIIHMNVRYFELDNGTCWFGGGIDLTPHYVVEEDARAFHQTLKAACDKHHPAFYPKFKTWADDYFFIQHRNETRGVGGIFFDYLKPDEPGNGQGLSKTELFEFVKEVGENFAPIYTALMQKYANKPFTEAQKQWQYLRRGRYVEFNLVWDRGTKFGLETNGRTESILMSLPPQANWEYNFIPEPGTAEAETLNWLRKGVAW